MKAEKLAHQLEKMIEKLEQFSHTFQKSESQHDFDSSKADAISLLNDMMDLCHDDVEPEEDEE